MKITSLAQLERDTARCLTDDFNEAGRDSPDRSWQDILKKLAPAYGLVTPKLRPANKAAARILATCKKSWLQGRRDAIDRGRAA
jgi:hypothetical protein